MDKISRVIFAFAVAALIATPAKATGYTNGVLYNGIQANGIQANGIWQNGVYQNGVYENGVWQNGIWEDGAAKKGTMSFQPVRVMGIELPAETKAR
jgi:hypothetical protein